MATDIQEQVKVIAVFDKEVVPAKFKWKGRVYPVKEITYTWSTKDGDTSVVHFAVSDGESLFELAYNTLTMKWSLERTE